MASFSIIKLSPISRYRAWTSAWFKDDQGVSAVEFALILPVVVIILFGIIEFGILLYDKAVITNASREGARAGIVHVHDSMVTDAEIQAVVDNYTSSYLINLGAPTTTTTTTINRVDGDLTVSVAYQYDFLVLPNIGAVNGQIQLLGETVMRME